MKASFPVPLPFLLAVTVLSGCAGTPKTTLKDDVQDPVSKSVFVNMASDPDLVGLDIQMALEKEGFNADLSTGEAEKSQSTVEDGTITTYETVSESNAPYELIVSYRRGGYPFKIKWRAVLRDRVNKEVIGNYKYDFNAAYQSGGWSNEKIITDMMSSLIVPYWDAE